MWPARLPYLVVALGCSACTASAESPPSTTSPTGAPAYADAIIAFSRDGQTTACVTSAAPCAGVSPPACGAEAALGAPDGNSFSLHRGATLEVAFLCSIIRLHASLD